MTDLNKKQAFWAEQLPAFKENYICLAQLEAVEFNNETGNFDALTKDATGFDLEDILEAYHSVNTGWSMWLRAKSQEKAKAQAVPDTHIVVPKVANKKMVNAGYEAHDGFYTNGQVQDVYQAMIKASESGAKK
ncbi:TPA: hypothetical protein ACNH0Y_002866 [Acinetobacter baumannii]